ncbi:MAG: hypothetical protein ACXWJT_13595 [Xanthobacteraceae bacterium]
MPKLSAEPTRADVDKTIIRIRSAHRWPEAIVYDTNRTIISPPAITADASAESSSLEAFAQLPRTASIRPVTAQALSKRAASRPAIKTRTPVRRIASYQPIESRAVLPAGW